MPPKEKKKPKKKKNVADDGLSQSDLEYKGLDLTRQLALEKVDALNSRIEALKKENESYKARLAKSEKDTHEFVAYFQREMEQKDAVIASLKDEMMKKESEFRMASDLLTHECEKKVIELSDRAERRESQLKRSLQNAEDEVTELAAYRDHKAHMEEKVLHLQTEIKRSEEKHMEKMTAHERKFLEEKAKAQRDLERKIEEMRQVARLEAQSGLDMDTRKVILDNRRMAEELRFQLQMMGELQSEKKQVEERSTDLRRQVEIFTEKEEEYARQRHAQQREIKQLREKVLNLQAQVNEHEDTLTATKTEIKKKALKEVDEHKLDAQGLRQLLLLKNKELRHIKKLAQTILDQRTEVEQYFLEALADVKQRIKQQRITKHRKDMAVYKAQVREAQRTGLSSKFPKIRPNAGLRNLEQLSDEPSQIPSTPSKKVQLGDLTLEDRERVLRLLFAKINNVQGFVEALPSHPLTSMSNPSDGMGGHPPQAPATMSPNRRGDSRMSFGEPRYSQTQPVSSAGHNTLRDSMNRTGTPDWFGGTGPSSPSMPGMA